MISCYFDDSGKESDLGNRIVCAAGYMALDNFWDMFLQAWGQHLLKHGIGWLHLKDFMASQDEYALKGWGWPEKHKILREFVNVIKATHLTGLGVAVDADAWRKIPKELTEREGTAQEFCFMRLMGMVVRRMKISCPRDYVAVYFDCDQAFTSARFKRFIGVREHSLDAGNYLQSFTIAEPRTHLPLQAADLLAWETRKELMRKLGGFESRPEFNFLFETFLNIHPDYESELWTESEIEEKIIKPFLSGSFPQ
jgi:hypothetical protein